MKRFSKIIIPFLLILATCSFSFLSCNESSTNPDVNSSANQGTPGLEYYSLSDSTCCVKMGSSTAYLEHIEIPPMHEGKTVTEIADAGFKEAKNLESIIIPDTITEIGDEAFYDCTSLMKVTIGNGVISIQTKAFAGCASLTNIIIPDNVVIIGKGAFDRCINLSNVSIGKGVRIIKNEAFSWCHNISEVHIEDIKAWLNISFQYQNSNPCFDGANLYLNNELLTSITIPDGTTSIGDYVFRGCESLESITIPNSVTSIGEMAFCGCINLTEINFEGTDKQWSSIECYDMCFYDVPAIKNKNIKFNVDVE